MKEEAMARVGPQRHRKKKKLDADNCLQQKQFIFLKHYFLKMSASYTGQSFQFTIQFPQYEVRNAVMKSSQWSPVYQTSVLPLNN